MTTYRNPASYRAGFSYRGSSGVFQKPLLSRSYPIAARNGIGTETAAAVAWGGSVAEQQSASLNWAIATACTAASIVPWGNPAALAASVATAYSYASQNTTAVHSSWSKTQYTNAETSVSWGAAATLNPADFSLSWSETYRADAEISGGFLTITHRYGSEFFRNRYSYRNYWRYSLKRRALALDNLSSVKWGGATAKLQDSNLPWGDGFHAWGKDTPIEWTDDPRPLPDQEPPIEPDIEEFYNVATDLTVIDLATSTALAVSDVSISLDIDSLAWTLSARVLNRASMNLAMPRSLIKVETMGHEWIFIVRNYTSERDIGKTWRINGLSQSAELDAPWSDASSHQETAAITWKQAIEALLPVGWTADFDSRITDYAIPAGGWSYADKTPKGALSELLDAVGAVAIPALADKTLHIQGRYKYAPWEYNLISTEADAIVHEAMIWNESGEHHPATQNLGVIVSGNNQHGVITEVLRAGSDGLPLAADVYHELITDQDAGRQKGKQVLSASGDKMLVTLETLITDEQASPGLVLPGHLVEVISDGETWRGLCLSTAISGAGMPAITQNLTIERDYGNHN